MWIFSVYKVLLTLRWLRSFSLGSLGAFPIFDNLVSRTRLVVEQNGVKFGAQGWVFTVYKVVLTVKCLRSFWIVGCFSDFRQPCISKTGKHKPKSLCYSVLCGHYPPSCQADRESPWASCIYSFHCHTSLYQLEDDSFTGDCSCYGWCAWIRF